MLKDKPSPLSDKFDKAYYDSIIKTPGIEGLSAKALLATEQRVPGLGNGVLQDILFNVGTDRINACLRLEFRSVKIMYERMLLKEVKPTLNDIYNLIGDDGTNLLKDFDKFLRLSYDIVSEIRFPFGNKYGWGIKYSHRTKHLCYVFPETGSFTVTIQIGEKELPGLYKKLESFLPKTRELWNGRYPCGEGGWLHYRVFSIEEIEDIKELIKIKKNPIEKN